MTHFIKIFSLLWWPGTKLIVSPRFACIYCLEREMATTPVFLPEESHGQRNLAGFGPWGCKSRTRRSDYTTTTTVCKGVSSPVWGSWSLETINEQQGYQEVTHTVRIWTQFKSCVSWTPEFSYDVDIQHQACPHRRMVCLSVTKNLSPLIFALC